MSDPAAESLDRVGVDLAVEDPGEDGDDERWLRAALANEQARARNLEDQLAALKASESFRIGQAISIATGRRLGRAFGFLLGRSKRERLLAASRRLELPAAARSRSSPRTDEPVVFLCLNEGEEGTRRALEEISALVSMLVAVEPVVVTDAPDAEGLADRRFVVEHVVGFDEWVRLRPASEWGPYVARRVAGILAEYGARKVLSMPADEKSRATAVAFMSPAIVPAMGRSETNLV